MKLKTLALALATGVAVSGACPAMAEIRIGAFTSATGPASFLGEPQRLTIDMLVKDINESGGINGENIRIFYYDDMSDASASRNFATRMIEEDEVVAVIGGSGTGNSMAVIPVVEDAEIPFVSFSGGVEIIEPVREWVFKPPHTDRMACEKIFGDMKVLGLTRAALISGQGGFAQSMAKQCSELAPSVGIEILAQESYGPRDSDVTPQLNRIRAIEGVEAVINADVGQGPTIVTRNFRQLGMEQTLYMSHAAATQGYLEAVAGDGEGIRIPAPSLLVVETLADDNPQKAMLIKYRDQFIAATGRQPDAFGGYAHDGLLLLVDAMKRAGTSEPAAVRDALEATDGFVGTVGTIRMSPTDHLGIDLGSFEMLTIRDGKWAPTTSN
jgi:branched-chain amino acid transport system substrate-binding protein